MVRIRFFFIEGDGDIEWNVVFVSVGAIIDNIGS